MKLQAFAILLAFVGATQAHSQQRRSHIKRQAPPPPQSSSPPAGPSQPSPSTSRPATSTPAANSPSGAPTSNGQPQTIPPPVNTPPPPPTGPTPTTGIFGLTSGKPAEPTDPVTATFAAGATPPIAGAPGLPSPFVFNAAEWPLQDKIPDTNSPEVQNWMRELDGFYIPEIPPTADGSCAGDPAAAADAANRGWWTCGGHTRATDVTACPDKLTWGVSFDDGPSPYTPTLLKYLTAKALKATFFVVGSRVIERPQVLVEQYMTGHEISVHTWSHKHLTSLTNDEIVAELGWTRKAIKEVLGVTPTTMRPPYGDIDDRVRAISLAMGLTPIIWTRTPSAGQFDTNDWQVAGGLVTGVQSFQTFQAILGNATVLDTGFIVLEHDLYEITVELATQYTLPTALTYNPPLTLEAIGQCLKVPTSNLYYESTKNLTFPYRNNTLGGYDIDGNGVVDTLKSAAMAHTPFSTLVTVMCAAVLAAFIY